MRRRVLLLPVLVSLVVAGCGGGDGDGSAGRPSVVVTTNILGDVVGNLVGGAADVVTIMPVGTDPHHFQASARQAADMREADLLIVNGAGFEEGLLEVVESAEADGVPIYAAISAVETLRLGVGHGHEEDGHDEDGAEDEGDVDPHFFTDPARMATAARAILDELLERVPELDTAEVRGRASDYIDELDSLDGELDQVLAAVPEERRVLVTNHEVFGYFADRYGFEVIGTLIPGGSTSEGAAAGDLADLIEEIRREGVPAIFAETSSPADLARTLAKDVGAVEVVELFSESLGEDGSGGATFLEMMRTNAERIADALS